MSTMRVKVKRARQEIGFEYADVYITPEPSLEVLKQIMERLPEDIDEYGYRRVLPAFGRITGHHQIEISMTRREVDATEVTVGKWGCDNEPTHNS